MNTITKPQIAKIHVLLNNNGMLNDKKEIVRTISSGRTESSRELSFEEARHLIKQLVEYDPKERQKALIFSLAYRSGLIYGSTGEDKKMNAAKLNLFLKERGAVKKGLHEMNLPELIKTHRQFEAIAKSTQKSKDNKQAANAVGNLLNELNISIK